MSEFSDEQIKDYLSHPHYCPDCESQNISALGDFENDTIYAWQTVRCDDCNEEWFEYFTMNSIGRK